MKEKLIATAISLGVLAVLIAFINLVLEDREARKYDARCERVLRCLDAGVNRPHCDALYPGCEAPTEED